MRIDHERLGAVWMECGVVRCGMVGMGSSCRVCVVLSRQGSVLGDMTCFRPPRKGLCARRVKLPGAGRYL